MDKWNEGANQLPVHRLARRVREWWRESAPSDVPAWRLAVGVGFIVAIIVAPIAFASISPLP